MVIMFRSLAMTGIFTTADMTPLMLLFRYFKPFLAPEPIYSLEVYKPALFSKLDGYPAIAIPRMLHMQDEQIINNRLILIRQFRLIPLGASGLL
jgi:hypothetical protein